jgi:hypothetical protein
MGARMILRKFCVGDEGLHFSSLHKPNFEIGTGDLRILVLATAVADSVVVAAADSAGSAGDSQDSGLAAGQTDSDRAVVR